MMLMVCMTQLTELKIANIVRIQSVQVWDHLEQQKMWSLIAPKQPSEKSHSRNFVALGDSVGDGAGHFQDVVGGGGGGNGELVIQELH